VHFTVGNDGKTVIICFQFSKTFYTPLSLAAVERVFSNSGFTMYYETTLCKKERLSARDTRAL